MRISSNMSKLLLDATLSVAIPTFIPASSIAFTFAIPEPSFKLLFGLCATRTSCSAKMHAHHHLILHRVQ